MKKVFLLLVAVGFTLISKAQIVDPAHWNSAVQSLGNGEFEIMITVTLDDGWHIFSKDYAGISVPATLTIDKSDSYVEVGKLREQGELIKEEIEIGGEKEMAMYYKNKVVFVQTVKVLTHDATIKGSIEYMTCKEVCVPPAVYEFSINIHNH